MCDSCRREESKQGSYKMLGRERKKGGESGASKGQGLKESQYVLNILFAKFCFQ